ncbi:MAG: hypothetical protein O4860_15385 [Trichodesmium sp. St2_bin2_1]|nr:hypothetical protein [Trichodesmium sp. St2_bin2_1]
MLWSVFNTSLKRSHHRRKQEGMATEVVSFIGLSPGSNERKILVSHIL